MMDPNMIEDKMKVLFLDIDGVLNSDVYMSSEEYLAECKVVGVEPKGNEVMNKAHYLHIDPAAIKLVNNLVERSDVKVIISSTWRKKYSLEELRAMFNGRGATFRLAGVTPARMSWRPRGHDVREFLADLKWEHGKIPEAFVIIDDIDEFSIMNKHFIQTYEAEGITKEHVEQALKILGIE